MFLYLCEKYRKYFHFDFCLYVSFGGTFSILKKNVVHFQHEIFMSEKKRKKNLLAALEFLMFVPLAKMFSEYYP